MACIKVFKPFGCGKCNTPTVSITKAGMTDENRIVIIGKCSNCHNDVSIDMEDLFSAFYPQNSTTVN